MDKLERLINWAIEEAPTEGVKREVYERLAKITPNNAHKEIHNYLIEEGYLTISDDFELEALINIVAAIYSIDFNGRRPKEKAQEPVGVKTEEEIQEEKDQERAERTTTKRFEPILALKEVRGKRPLKGLSDFFNLFPDNTICVSKLEAKDSGALHWFKPLKQGITVYRIMSAKVLAVLSLGRLRRRLSDGEIICDLFFKGLKGRKNVEENVSLPDDMILHQYDRNLFYVGSLTIEQAIYIIIRNDLINIINEKLERSNKSAIKNFNRIEKKLN